MHQGLCTRVCAPGHRAGLLRHRWPGPTLADSAAVGLGWDLRICFSSSSQGLLVPLLWDPTSRTADEDLVLCTRSAAQCGQCWPRASITNRSAVHADWSSPPKTGEEARPTPRGRVFAPSAKGTCRGLAASPHPGCCLVGAPVPQMETPGLNSVLS